MGVTRGQRRVWHAAAARRPFLLALVLLPLHAIAVSARPHSAVSGAPAPSENHGGVWSCRSAVGRQPRDCRLIREDCAEYGSGLVNYVAAFYCVDAAWRPWVLALVAVWLSLLFVCLGVSASEYLSPNVGALARHLRMPEGLAGVTLLALGNGAPDLSSTFSAVRAGSAALAFGQIIGSASFIAGVVVAATTLVAPAYSVSRLTYLRELCFYAATVALAVTVVLLKRLTPLLAVCMVVLYTAYVGTVVVTTYAEEVCDPARRDAAPEHALTRRPSESVEGPPTHMLVPDAEAAWSADDERASLLMPHWTAASEFTPHRRQQSVVAMGTAFDDQDPWNLELLRASSPGAQVLGSFLRQHRKSLLAAVECGSLPEEAYGGHSPDLGSGLDAAHALSRASTQAPALPRQAYRYTHRRADSAPTASTGEQLCTPMEASRVWPTQLTPAPLFADDGRSHGGSSGSAGAAHAPAPRRPGALRAILCAFVPTLRHWHAAAPLMLKLFVAASALPVLALTLTVPVAAHPLQDQDMSLPPSAHACSNARPGDTHRWATTAVSYVRAACSAAFLYWVLCGSGPLAPVHSLEAHALIGAGVVAVVLGAYHACRACRSQHGWLATVPCLVGFVSGIAWVTMVADEIISITQALGLALGLSEEILGLTIVGFGNSVGDLVTNVTVARMGYPMMALCACFSGPMLSLLLGVGVAVCASIGQAVPLRAPLEIPITSPTVAVGAACLAINTLIFLVAIPRQSFHMTRATGVSAFLVYLVGMAVNVYIEW